MFEPLVLRPDPGPSRSPRAPFFRTAAMVIDDGELTVIDEDGARHRYPLGDAPGEVSRLGIVHNFSILYGAGLDTATAHSWLLVLDSTNDALVATDLELWDEGEVHTWWCRVHGGSLVTFLDKRGGPQEHLPRTHVDRTLLLEPTRGTGILLAGAAFSLTAMLPIIPIVSDVPAWPCLVPMALVMTWLALSGEVRGRRATRARMARLHDLERRVPLDRAGDGP